MRFYLFAEDRTAKISHSKGHNELQTL